MVAPQTSLGHHALRALVVAAIAFAWASLFTFPPLTRIVELVVDGLRPHLPGVTGWSGWEHVLASTIKVLVAGALLALVGVALHGPTRAGMLPPTSTGGRLTVVAVVFTLGVRAVAGWDVIAARISHAADRPEPWLWLGADAALIVVEQLVAQGAVLTLALPFGLPAVDERRRVGLPGLRFLAGLGVGALENPRLPGPRTLLAVPAEAWPAIAAQGLVFTVLGYLPHGAPSPAAFLGGVAAGWLTARTGSLWPALLVGLTTSHVPLAAVALWTH